MDFGLSEEQSLLESTVRRFLEETAPVSRVREIVGADSESDAGIWQGLAELGVVGVIVPEAHGGAGLSFLDAAVVAESLGYAVTPAPFLGTAVLAPVALLESGSDALCREWLPRIARGDAQIGVAMTEVFSRREGAGLQIESGRLNGKALFSIGGSEATAFLIAADEEHLALVPRDAAGLSVEPLSTLDATRGVSELVFDGVEPAALLPNAGEAIRRTLDAGRIALAADSLGAAERMLELAVTYAGERRQFGRLIGSFQAVKHLCAEMVAELEPARSLLWYAAHAFDAARDEAPLMAAHVKAHLSEVSTRIAKTSTEVHGGIGFTDEQNLHFWFKRISLNRQLLGGPAQLRERAAALQGWTDPDPAGSAPSGI